MQFYLVDLLGLTNLGLSAINFFRSPTCNCVCEVPGVQVEVIREILKHKEENSSSSVYIPWWLIWLALAIGILIGGASGFFLSRFWYKRSVEGRVQAVAGQAAQVTGPVTPKSLSSIRDGRA